jgi:hypothetical protein
MTSAAQPAVHLAYRRKALNGFVPSPAALNSLFVLLSVALNGLFFLGAALNGRS